MKVLLLKDVYKLGRAGDVKKVANGYGRNFLIPQGLATLATPGSLKQVELIQKRASEQRAILNNEMSGVAEKLAQLTVTFASKAGETGKLYGSITTQMIAEAINKKLGLEIDRRDVETQPIRLLGEHKALVRLTVDLVPEIKILVHREGEAVSSPKEAAAKAPVVEEVVDEEEAEVDEVEVASEE